MCESQVSGCQLPVCHVPKAQRMPFGGEAGPDEGIGGDVVGIVVADEVVAEDRRVHRERRCGEQDRDRQVPPHGSTIMAGAAVRAAAVVDPGGIG